MVEEIIVETISYLVTCDRNQDLLVGFLHPSESGGWTEGFVPKSPQAFLKRHEPFETQEGASSHLLESTLKAVNTTHGPYVLRDSGKVVVSPRGPILGDIGRYAGDIFVYSTVFHRYSYKEGRLTIAQSIHGPYKNDEDMLERLAEEYIQSASPLEEGVSDGQGTESEDD